MSEFYDTTDESKLVHRILDSMLASAYAMTALVRLIGIKSTCGVATASVSCERKPVMRINPEFVRRWCQTDEHLFMLVMHEVHHILLGHTRQFPRGHDRERNIAFDAVINALLCERFPQAVHTSFFTQLYGGRTDALRLLAPPGETLPEDPGLQVLHQMLYEDQSVGSKEIYMRLRDAVGKCEAGGLRPTGTEPIGAWEDGRYGELLGSHGEEENWGTDGDVDADVVEAIREIIEKWPPARDPRGRSLASRVLHGNQESRLPERRVLEVLRKSLLEAAWKRVKARTTSMGKMLVNQPLPNPRDRKAVLSLACGRRPLLWQGVAERFAREDECAARVYLDVSDSMVSYLAYLYGGLNRLKNHIEPEVRLFSTCVERIALKELKEGSVRTTGGTDIDCVLQDIFEQPNRKVLLITDGYVGSGDPDLWRHLKRAGVEIRVLLTPEGWRRDLCGHVRAMVALPKLPA